MKKISFNLQIILSIIGSLVFALLYTWLDLHSTSVERLLASLGRNFINALQLIAVPLVLCSVIVAVSSIENTKELSRIGFVTLLLYFITTILSVSLGLLIGNIAQPGSLLRKLGGLQSITLQKAETILPSNTHTATSQAWIPNNFIVLLSSNHYLTLIVLFASIFGIAVLKLEPESKKALLATFKGLQDVFMRIMSYIIRITPIGTFCLVSSQFIKFIQQGASSFNLLLGIGSYAMTVTFGIFIMLLVVYPLIVKLCTKVGYITFLKTMQPAQTIAFSTACSTATIYTTDKQVKKLHVPAHIRKFVLSLGATVNMDGTALYQGIAALFVTQMFGYHLTFLQQLYIVYYITLSTIGVAGMPGASFVTSSILLRTLNMDIGLSEAQMLMAFAILYLPDRLLDMLRTAANITGDAMVALLVSSLEKIMKKPSHSTKKAPAKPTL